MALFCTGLFSSLEPRARTVSVMSACMPDPPVIGSQTRCGAVFSKHHAIYYRIAESSQRETYYVVHRLCSGNAKVGGGRIVCRETTVKSSRWCTRRAPRIQPDAPSRNSISVRAYTQCHCQATSLPPFRRLWAAPQQQQQQVAVVDKSCAGT